MLIKSIRILIVTISVISYAAIAEEPSTNPQELYQMAQAYQRGEGNEKDINKAKELYKQAAIQGHTQSEYQLGNILYIHDRDSEGAVSWLLKAAEKENVSAQHTLGIIFFAKNPVQDPLKSFYWFQRAALNGYMPAISWVSLAYGQGSGVDPDQVKMLAWMITENELKQPRGSRNYKRNIKSLKKSLTPEQFTAAHEMAQSFISEIQGKTPSDTPELQ
jgi:hypothetical protein